MLYAGVHAQLGDAGTDRHHGLPIKRLLAELDPKQLPAGQMARILRKIAKVLSG
jgi:hypothetical protein